MTLVVKLGSDIDGDAVLDDIAALTAQGTRVVLVHGGGAEADRLNGQLGRTVEHLRSADGTSARRTDAAALDALTMALLGRVKPALLSGLRRRGIAATGLSGAGGGGPRPPPPPRRRGGEAPRPRARGRRPPP
ncbi:hypothetical protein ABTY23_26350, partial [Streptomyces sp. NPDC096068]